MLGDTEDEHNGALFIIYLTLAFWVGISHADQTACLDIWRALSFYVTEKLYAEK